MDFQLHGEVDGVGGVVVVSVPLIPVLFKDQLYSLIAVLELILD